MPSCIIRVLPPKDFLVIQKTQGGQRKKHVAIRVVHTAPRAPPRSLSTLFAQVPDIFSAPSLTIRLSLPPCYCCALVCKNEQWVTLIAPSKYPGSPEEGDFSKLLESVRKDVECFFGILKGRFRILKLRLAYHSRDDIDNIFFTCCILHNMLHSFDGMSVFEENVDWAGSAGLHDPKDHAPDTDFTSVGVRSDTDPDEYSVNPQHALLKSQLVESFAYRKEHKDVVWLSRPK